MQNRVSKGRIKAMLAIAMGTALLIVLFYNLPHTEQPETVRTESYEETNTDTKSVFDRYGVALVTDTKDTEEVIFSPILNQINSTTTERGAVALALDSELQQRTYAALEKIALAAGYKGGAGVIMDMHSGEVLTLVSYTNEKETSTSTHNAAQGLFVPGSIVKPFIAIAALTEKIIEPETEILSTGLITLPDSHQPDGRALFRDWRAHGYVDMRKALGVSSNVYFYAIGGGHENQPGLGIERIEKYLRMFGFGSKTGIDTVTESEGRLPNPEWKYAAYNNDDWRVADTYLVAIGQHGYEVTPLQATRAVAAIANGGQLIVPKLILDNAPQTPPTQLPLAAEDLKVVREGMEYAVVNGTASGLYFDGVSVAAKTGTAEVDTNKEHIHSWLIGYFPHDKPKYAFTFMLESGPWGEEVGAVSVAGEVIRWILNERPEYVR